MKITQGLAHDAARALADLLDSNRQIIVPQTGKYRIAKMQRLIEPHYALIEHQRTTLVQKYGEEVFMDAERTMSQGWNVTPNNPNFETYVKEWNAIREETIEISGLQPIPLDALGNDTRGISVMEFRLLGELVTDTFAHGDAKVAHTQDH